MMYLLLLRLPKKGFGVPLGKWFRTSLREFIWDYLTSPEFLGRGIVSPTFIRHLLEEHQSGRRDNHHTLWQLLMLELWFRDSVAPRECASPRSEPLPVR